MIVLDALLDVGSGPSYLNLFFLIGLRVALFLVAFGATILLFASKKMVSKVVGFVLLVMTFLVSILLLVVTIYALYMLYVQGIDGFPDVLLFILYILSLVIRVKYRT